MITPEQARAMAEEEFNAGRAPQDRRTIFVHEFDLGYVAAAPSNERDERGRLVEVGGGCVVIDKETGEITARPLLDPESVAQDYREYVRRRQQQ